MKLEKKRKLAENKTRRAEQENVVEKFQHLEKIIDNVIIYNKYLIF